MAQTITRHRFLAMMAGGVAARGAPAQNIILILSDDLGWAEAGCYGNGFNRTPRIDRLAAGGVRFTNAYAAAPVCSPTRASILTGHHPARVGITDYLRADDERHLAPGYPTVSRTLAEAGYRCGLVGKWHLMGDYRTRKGDPKLHGFHEVICSESRYIGAGDYFHPYDFAPEVEARAEGEYLTDRLNQEAVDFVRRNRGGPFFLMLSHYAPHTRMAGKPELVARYAKDARAGKDRNNPELAAMLESIDEGVGMIVDEVERQGLGDRTAVVFTSDNGGEDRVTSNAPLRAGKSTLYEGGIRIPMVVSAPGFGRAGAVCDVPVATTDFMPTFLEMAGIGAGRSRKLDGVELHRAVRGERGMRERELYWHYPLEKPHFLGGRSSGAVRKGDWKLIEYFDMGSAELYNLREDPGETVDLAARRPELARELRQRLARWRRETVKGGSGV